MKTAVIASATLLPELLAALAAAPCEIVHRHARDDLHAPAPVPLSISQGMHPALLPVTGAQLLVIELSHAAPEGDLHALEPWMLQHPDCSVIAVLQGRAQHASDLLRSAMRAGVRELIDWPTERDALLRAVQHAALRTGAPLQSAHNGASAARGKLAVFISASGGRSATVLGCNVAALLASEHQRRTLYLDLDLAFADASYLLGEHHPAVHTHQLARDIARLDGQLLQASVSRVAPQFDLLAAPGDGLAAPAMADLDLAPLIHTARQTHECVLLELPRNLDGAARPVLEQASLVFLVTDALLPFLRDARRIAQTLADAGISEPRLRLVLNRFDRAGDLTPREVESATGLRIAHTLPAREDELRDSLNAGLMLSLWRPGSPWVRALRPLAEEIAGSAAPRSADWLGRLLGRKAPAARDAARDAAHAGALALGVHSPLNGNGQADRP